MQEPLLKIDSQLSKVIGFTSEYFESGTIYNLLPRGVYITGLIPKKPESIDQMFDLIDRKKMLFRYTAPQSEVHQILVSRGYYLARDVAHTVYFCNFIPKKNVESLIIPLTMEKIV